MTENFIDKVLDELLEGSKEVARYMAKQSIRTDLKYWRSAGLLSDTNTMERPFIFKVSLRPKHITLMGDLLVWRPDKKDAPPRKPQPSDIGILNKFVRLSTKNASPQDFLKFAKDWGVIGVCQHLRSFPHLRFDIDNENQKPCQYFELAPGQYFEPLKVWRDYSLEARAILRIAARFHQDRPGDFEDWKVLNPTLKGPLPRSKDWFLIERIELAKRIERFIQQGHPAVRINWYDSSPSPYVSGNLLGLIGFQIMFAVTRSQGIAICTGCSSPYPPRRRPSPGRSSFCDTCREAKTASRESQAARRKKSKSN